MQVVAQDAASASEAVVPSNAVTVSLPSAPPTPEREPGESVRDVPQPVQEGRESAALPNLPRGAEFVHTVRTADLTMRMMNRLARVIHLCQGKGTHPFRVMAESGEVLWDEPGVLVNPTEFAVILRMPDV